MSQDLPGTGSSDAGDALSADLTAEELSDLANERPDLWAQIEQHQNVYPELLEWIAEGRAEAELAADDDPDATVVRGGDDDQDRTIVRPAAPSGPAATSVLSELPVPTAGIPAPPTEALPAPDIQPPAGLLPPPAVAPPLLPPPPMTPAALAPPAPLEQPPAAPPAAPPAIPSAAAGGEPRKRPWILIAIIAAAVIVLAGGYVGLAALNGWWPFASDSAAKASETAEKSDSESSADDAESRGLALPREISEECPAPTYATAWVVTQEGGWALVCGLGDEEPSFVAYQMGGANGASYSIGNADPESSEAKAAVDWVANKRLFTADVERTSTLTLDLTAGEMYLQEKGEKAPSVEEQVARFAAIPLGGNEQTVVVAEREDDTAEEERREAARDADRRREADRESQFQAEADAQVRAVMALLTESSTVRQSIKTALRGVDACDVSRGTIESIRDDRRRLLDETRALEVDLIPEGEALLSDLIDAANANYEVALERVPRADSNNCTPSATEYNYAVASDSAKERVAERWNRAVVPKFDHASRVTASNL